jgi:hypothetical protein
MGGTEPSGQIEWASTPQVAEKTAAAAVLSPVPNDASALDRQKLNPTQRFEASQRRAMFFSQDDTDVMRRYPMRH